MSRNLNLALIVSFLLHILLLLVLLLFDKKHQESEEKYTPIGNMPLKIQEEAKLPTSPPPKPKAPPAPSTPTSKPQEMPTEPKPPAKKEPPKKEVKKEIQKKEVPKKEVPKSTKNIVKKEVKKPIPKKEPPKKEDRNQTEQSPRKSNLESFLSKPSEPSVEDVANSFTDNKIEKLYGEEFGSFTQEQREFIRDNLSRIGQITQKHLKYPNLAGELQQDGQNIVEFYLHPNGDITELRLISKTGYAILDRNSVRTIEIAYKDYPRPETKTKIRIYVNYVLY